MSEVQSRASGSRGRGSHRGGRGGYRGTRNGTKTSHKSEDQENQPPASPEEQGEVGELKRKYGIKFTSLREMFSGWSDQDLVYALKETDGDVDATASRISDGSISQWGEVKKKQPKSKETHTSSPDTHATGRGGRGRGHHDDRGRGRGNDRGRSARGVRAPSHANGNRTETKAANPGPDGWVETAATSTVEVTGAWDSAKNGDTAGTGDWANEASKEAAPKPVAEQPKASVTAPVSKPPDWAALFAQPKPTAQPKKAPTKAPVAQGESANAMTSLEDSIPQEELAPPEQGQVGDEQTELPEPPRPDPPIELTPSKDELTETNLELLPDSSNPPVTATAASTTASTQDPLASMNNTVPVMRPVMSGYAASAFKATSTGVRAASFQRRMLEQQEAVVMPGNHAVDRTAVQFGSLGLNGSGEDLDVDEDREEPETRAQLPDDSPVAPRASLPPGPAMSQTSANADAMSGMGQKMETAAVTQRQPPGFSSVTQPSAPSGSPPSATSYADQYRYGPNGQKGYDPFGQQSSSQPALPQAPSQEPFTGQVPTHPLQPASSAPNDYSYYGAAQREAYQNYYAPQYGQPPVQAQETQQRSGSAFGVSSQEATSQYATARPQPAYGQPEAQNSGTNTPNPTMPAHQSQHSQQLPHGQAGQGAYPYAGYPSAYGQQYSQYAGGANYANQMQGRYGPSRPMFDDVRRQDSDYYQSNQYGYGHNQQYAAGAGYNKSSMYAQPQHQYSYEHSSSPANAGGYAQQSVMGGRDTTYGRTGSAQPSEAQQSAGSSAFAGVQDAFGRSHSGFGGQGQPVSQQHSGQQLGEDSSKSYDAPKAGGPSPAISQAHRPTSANNVAGTQSSAQSGAFPPPHAQHSSQQAFSGYPQYGGLGNAGAQHQAQSHHQTSGYGGGYGSGTASFSQYGNYGSGRGWNGNYGGGH